MLSAEPVLGVTWMSCGPERSVRASQSSAACVNKGRPRWASRRREREPHVLLNRLAKILLTKSPSGFKYIRATPFSLRALSSRPGNRQPVILDETSKTEKTQGPRRTNQPVDSLFSPCNGHSGNRAGKEPS